MRKGILVAVAVMFPLGVYAEGDTPDVLGAPTSQEMFKSLDTNKDGYINSQEATADAKLADRWAIADHNGDGKVEETEFSAFEAGTVPGKTPLGIPDKPTVGGTPAK